MIERLISRRTGRENLMRIITRLRSGKELSKQDRDALVKVIEALMQRGRQPGSKSPRADSPYGDRRVRIARDVIARRDVWKAANKRKRMPGDNLKALAKQAIKDDYARHPRDHLIERGEVSVDDIAHLVIHGHLSRQNHSGGQRGLIS